MRKIIPAIYALTVDELKEKLAKSLDFSDTFQIDLMDGAFVPEKSFDIVELNELPASRSYELHLMVAHPLEYIGHLHRLGIKKVIFHDEIDEDTATDIDAFKKEGLEVFLAINPESEPEKVEKHIPKIDGIMLMSVDPGRAGQEFIRSTLGKARYLRGKYPNLLIEMDGGINKDNISEVFEAGVNIAVVGSGLLKAENPGEEWEELQKYIT